MANFIYKNDCLVSTPGENVIVIQDPTSIACPCCEVTCYLIQSDLLETLTLESLEIIGAGASEITIVSIDNVPYTGATDPPLPIICGEGEIKVVIQICAIWPPIHNTSFAANLALGVSHGGGIPVGELIDMDWLQMAINASPPTMPGWTGLVADSTNGIPNNAFLGQDFGQVNIGFSSASLGFTIYNPGECDINIFWLYDNCPLDLDGSPFSCVVANMPEGWITIPANGQLDLLFVYTPTLDCPAVWSCDIKMRFCDWEDGHDFGSWFLTGEALPPLDCLTCTDVILNTERHFLTQVTGLCNPINTIIQTAGAIGESKFVDFKFTYSHGLQTGWKLWFNPVLYDFLCDYVAYYPGGIINDPPITAWYLEYTNGIPATQMQLIGAGAAAVTQRNMTAEFTQTSANTFTIRFTFFLIMDLEDWVSSLFLENRSKLLKGHKNEPYDLTPTLQSVYNMDKSLCAMVYVIDPNQLVPDPVSGIDYPLECYILNGFRVSWRFYNKGLYLGASEFTTPVFNFERSGNAVTQLSTIYKTEVEFEVFYFPTIVAPFTQPSDIVFWLIETTNTNNSVDFETNYNSSRAEMTTNIVPGVIDNLLESPSAKLIQVAPAGTSRTSCLIGTNVAVGQKYRLIAVIYDIANEMVNSFISDEIGVTDVPDEECCPVVLGTYFQDYNSSFVFVNCLKPTLKERIDVGIWFTGLKTLVPCMVEWGVDEVTAGATWQNYLKTIKLVVYRKVDDYPSAGQRTLFVFNEYISTRDTAVAGNWINSNQPLNVEDLNYYTGNVLIHAHLDGTRVRYESQLLPPKVMLENPTDDICERTDVIGALASTYITANNVNFNWADEEIFFEWQIDFDFSPLFGGSEYKITQIRKMTIEPFDYEDPPLDFRNLDEITLHEYTGSPSNPAGNVITGSVLCMGTLPFDCLVVRVHKTIANPHTFIAFFDKFPYSINNLKEYERYISGAFFTMPQLQEAPIINADYVFDQVTNHADFVVDLSSLTDGKYQFCGLAKRMRLGWVPRPTTP